MMNSADEIFSWWRPSSRSPASIVDHFPLDVVIQALIVSCRISILLQLHFSGDDFCAQDYDSIPTARNFVGTDLCYGSLFEFRWQYLCGSPVSRSEADATYEGLGRIHSIPRGQLDSSIYSIELTCEIQNQEPSRWRLRMCAVDKQVKRL